LTRIIVPSENKDGINSLVAAHFGRAPFYTIVELDAKKQVIEAKTQPNTGEHMGGSGHPHETLIDMEPNYIIASAMGMGGIISFKNAGINVLKAEGTTVKEVINNFQTGALKELTGGCQHAHEHHH
jgi:predicted Fe-Mo cluster-binding NifX family protein